MSQSTGGSCEVIYFPTIFILRFRISLVTRSNIRALRQAVIYFAFSILTYKKNCMIITVLSTDGLGDSSPLCLPYHKKGKGTDKSTVHPRTDYEGSEAE
jgi:hypothetical protein